MPISTQQTGRRQYIRLDSVFPVRMRLVQAQDRTPVLDWIQGFTSDISKGGLCVSFNALPPEAIAHIKSGAMHCSLEIEVPLGRLMVRALAKISWFKDKVEPTEKYFVGLQYLEISPKDSAAIVLYARLRQFFVPLTMLVVAILTACIIVSGYVALRLSEGNRSLTDRLAIVSQAHMAMKQKMDGMGTQGAVLTKRINDLMGELEMLNLEKQKTQKQKETLRVLNAAMQRSAKEKITLQAQLAWLQAKQERSAADALRLENKKTALEKASIEQMYLAEAHYRLGDYTGALEIFSKNEFGDPAYLYYYGLTCEKLKLFDRALKLYRGLLTSGFAAQAQARIDVIEKPGKAQ